MKDIFEKIIVDNVWKIDGINTPCGPGSTIEYTDTLRKELLNFLIKNNIQSMLDAPCGDFMWMSQINFPKDFKYVGGDISETLIKNNKENYKNFDFCLFDITSDKFPDIDLLFCRDCLIHFSFEDIDKFFRNLVNSNIKFILLTNHRKNKFNYKDILTGDCRPINFTSAPYNFEMPIDFIDDTYANFIERDMCLWSIDTIKKYLKEKTT
jgi:SAM-dependent methyltransferase